MINAYPVFRLSAVSRQNMSSFSRVFNTNEIEYFLFIRVPELFAKEFELYQIDCIDDKSVSLSDNAAWEHESGRVWYRIKSSMLNMKSGYHMYRLCFVNKRTNDTSSLYISYVIQDNTPDKPYIYMNRDEEGCGCD